MELKAVLQRCGSEEVQHAVGQELSQDLLQGLSAAVGPWAAPVSLHLTAGSQGCLPGKNKHPSGE